MKVIKVNEEYYIPLMRFPEKKFEQPINKTLYEFFKYYTDTGLKNDTSKI
jgi:hypothetical protein